MVTVVGRKRRSPPRSAATEKVGAGDAGDRRQWRLPAGTDPLGRPLTVTEVAAPDLAPIIQQGPTFDRGSRHSPQLLRTAREAGVDTLILGCTHHPLVAPMSQSACSAGMSAWSRRLRDRRGQSSGNRQA